MELDEARAQFAAQGFGACAISYDSADVLAHFAARKGISIPLLSDPRSEIIKRFGLLNDTISAGDLRRYGMAYPGILIVDRQGIVRSKFFEEKHHHRMSIPTILHQELGLESRCHAVNVRTDQVTIAAYVTQERIRPGNRFALFVEVIPAQGAHIYAQGSEGHGYHPIALTIDAPAHCTVYSPRYPAATETIYIPELNESIPVFRHPIRILTDIALGRHEDVTSGTLAIRGRLGLQACDKSACYPPDEIQVAWVLPLGPPDEQRVPEHLRRELRRGIS